MPDRGQGALDAVVDLARRDAHVERPERDVLEHGRAEELVVGVLEDEPDLAPGSAGPSSGRRRCRRSGPSPWVGSWMPLRWSISVLLPAPFGPTSATFSPARDREVDAAQRLEAVRVAEVEVLDLDRGRGDAGSADAGSGRRAGARGRGRCSGPSSCAWAWSWRVRRRSAHRRGQPDVGRDRRTRRSGHEHGRERDVLARPHRRRAVEVPELALEPARLHRRVDPLAPLVRAQEQRADHRAGDRGPPGDRAAGRPVGAAAERDARARDIRVASSPRTAR